MKRTYGIIFVFLFLSPLFLLLFSPLASADTDATTYILSNDLIKNFKIASFNGKTLTPTGTVPYNLQFESQASWKITKEDVELIETYTQGDNVYLRYKVGATNKINSYTILSLAQAAYCMNQVTDNYQIAYYRHNNELGLWLYSWSGNIQWTHYNFGDIKTWNNALHIFRGPVVMTFDIAQSPLPDFQTISGDSLSKNFDYIAVSSAGVLSNLKGDLDKTAPTIVGINPLDYTSSTKNSETHDKLPNGKVESGLYITWDPAIKLVTDNIPDNTWDGGITVPTAGSSLNPTTKDGSPIWNPQAKQESMKDCKIQYQLHISPYVKEYYGTLSYTEKNVITQEKYFWQGPYIKSQTTGDFAYTKSVALQCTNRYVQTEIKVVFDIFASYKIDVKADDVEDFVLDVPEEYFDDILWSTTVDGFGRGTQYTATADPFDAFLDWLGNIFGNIWTWIIMFLILGVVIVVVVYVVVPYLRRRGKRQETKQ